MPQPTFAYVFFSVFCPRDRIFFRALPSGTTLRHHHNPQVLLLDEPLSGLDPRARIEMRNLLRRLGEMGKTIVVSSHILPELAEVCNKIGIIDRGVMNVNADVDEVMKQVRRQTVLKIGVEGTSVDAAKLVEQHDVVEHVECQNGEITVTLCEGVESYSDLSSLLIRNGHRLTLFREDELNLEMAFMALTKGMGSWVKDDEEKE